MKIIQNYRRISFVVLLAATLLIEGILQAGPQICLAKPLGSFVTRLGQYHAWLSNAIDQIKDKIPGSKRYGQFGDDAESLAILDIQGSSAIADTINVGRGGLGIGPKTAEAQLTALSSPRVLESDATGLQDAGEGLGYASAHPHFAGRDGDLATILQKCDTGTNKGVFKDSGFTPAEAMRDWKIVFEDPNVKVKGSTLRDDLVIGDSSPYHEMRVAAHFKSKEGHALDVAIGADQTPNPAKKADTLTDKAYIQSGERLGTLEGKWNQNANDLGDAIFEARQNGKHFIFAYSGGPGVVDLDKAANINLRLAEKYGIAIPNEVLDGGDLGKKLYDFLGQTPAGRAARFPNDTSYIYHVPIE
jgi:hypothetical protein